MTYSFASAIKAYYVGDYGVHTSSGAVTSWSDQSGNGYDLTPVSGHAAPVSGALRGSRNGITFTGGALLSNASISVGTHTIFVVSRMKFTGRTGYQTFVSFGLSGSDLYKPDYYFTEVDAPNGFFIATAQFGAPYNNFGDQTFGTDTMLLTRFAVDVTAKPVSAAFNSQDSSYNPASNSAAAASSTGMYVGGDPGDAFNGDIFEILIVNRAMTAREISEYESDVANRYNIATRYIFGTSLSTSLDRGALTAASGGATVGHLAGTSLSTSLDHATGSGRAFLAGYDQTVTLSSANGSGRGALRGASIGTSLDTAHFLAVTPGYLSGRSISTSRDAGTLSAPSTGTFMTGASITRSSDRAGILGSLVGIAGVSISGPGVDAGTLGKIALLSGRSVSTSLDDGALTFVIATGPAPPSRQARDDSFIGGYFQYATDLAPPWLSGQWGLPYLQSRGLVADATAQAYRAAIYARHVKICTPDALAAIGVDRRMPRYPNEAGESYRRRLAGAWRSYRDEGRRVGVVSALADAGIEAQVFESREYAAGARFSDWYWYHVVVTNAPIRRTDGTWNDPGDWNDPRPWDDAGSDVIELVRAVCGKWAPAHCKLGTITILLTNVGGTWDSPPGLWRDETGSWDDGSTLLQWVNYAGSAF